MNKVQIQFIKDALDNLEELTEWENDFINDIADKEEHYELTPKQNAILNRIQGKIV